MKAAIYIRVSTQLQETDRQRSELTEYANSHGYTITEVYEDQMSGFSNDRPSYNRLKEDAKKGLFDIVLFSEMSRMTRKNILLTEVDYFKDLNIQVFFQKQNILVTNAPNDLGTTILLSVLSAISGYEVALMKERMISGKLESAKKKPMRIGQSAYGYTANNGTIVIDRVQADHVVEIISKYASGWNVIKLCRYMTDKTGRSWLGSSISKILDKPIYRGYYTVYIGGQTVTQYYPELRIISDDLYESAQKTRDLNKRVNRRANNPKHNINFILNDLLYCPHCGRTIRGKQNGHSDGYICAGRNGSHRQKGNQCTVSASYNVKQLESIIWESVKTLSVKQTNQIDSQLQISETETLINDLHHQLQISETQLSGLDNELNNYIKRAVKYNLPDSAIDAYNDDIQRKKRDLNSNVIQLTDRLKTAKKQLTFLIQSGDDVTVMTLINQAEKDPQLKKKYLHEYINKIYVHSVSGYNIAQIYSNGLDCQLVVWKKYQKGNKLTIYTAIESAILPVVFVDGIWKNQDTDEIMTLDQVLPVLTQETVTI